MFGDIRAMERIDHLYVLLSAIDQLRGTEMSVDGTDHERMSASALRNYVSVMLRVPEDRTLRKAIDLMPRTESIPRTP
jgi:hypothetical protein